MTAIGVRNWSVCVKSLFRPADVRLEHEYMRVGRLTLKEVELSVSVVLVCSWLKESNDVLEITQLYLLHI